MITHMVEGNAYIESDEKAKINNYVISSEQIGIPRIYLVYHTTDTRMVLGKYSRGHTNLYDYKTLKLQAN